jgi:hypothetical protein
MVAGPLIVFKSVVRSSKAVSEFSKDNRFGRVFALNSLMQISVLRIMDLVGCHGIRRRMF